MTLAIAPLRAQDPPGTPPDSMAAADTSRVQRLHGVKVEVTRAESDAARAPWAVGAQDARDLRRGQATLSLDEALANIPGVVIANRYNYATDSRLSIRGAGSRANFGLRGVKVLLDGVPQSLPDGQSQLTNVDLAALARVEVLRGSASSLYGNGSGGVIAFTTDLSAPDRLGLSARVTSGSFGLRKTQLRASGRTGRTVGAVSASRTTWDGFRQNSSADTRQLLAAVDHAFSDRTTLSLRGGTAETPHALNPGALTLAEYALNPDSAAANNIRRAASRAISQRYASVRVRHATTLVDWSATVYGQRRFVDNPLAVSPPAPAGPTNGTLNLIDRRVLGLRLDATRRLAMAWQPRITAGLDVQRSHDGRRNIRITAGRVQAPSDTLLSDQAETVTSAGPFAQVAVDPIAGVTLDAGARVDRLTFRVVDRFLQDGADNSGERVMTASSGHLGVVWRAAPEVAPYANLSTAFETPTTTELANSPSGAGGFNPDLGPQRIRTLEVGARGRWRSWLGYEVAFFRADASDALVQFLETSGRAYFRNAGETRSEGVELGATMVPAQWLELRAAYTFANYRFTRYRVTSGATVDTLDGNRLAGVPRIVGRYGARLSLRGFAIDADQTLQAAVWGDDRNTVAVPGWGRGQLNVRASWSGTIAGWGVEPFASVQNALDQRYVGAVTLNGFGGRVAEPAPRRNWYAGLELRVPVLR
ncbi:MAG: TonB-dependent receptor [Gemmatimonadota bacterium]|nr:TonB-dependent receptor [Gemmatimonadota bacterium]